MPPYILSHDWQQQQETLRALIQRSLWLAERCADYDATQILRARLTNLEAPALLVVVGEVKAGKSSFINALLRDDICQVAPGPCTTRIQELVYGPDRNVALLGRSWERLTLPKEVLREVTIVDTPGTNSLIQDHQTITEKYVPQSDLVVFVFSAVNPHTKSAWELLTALRKDWHRKMVFVLQQADRASQKELFTNREHMMQYTRERRVENPIIFTLSAKRETEGMPDSGFAEFRNYLRNAIERGEVWRMKVEGAYETVRSVMTKLLARLHSEKQVIGEERAFYQELLNRVEMREAKAESLKRLIIGKITATYDELARQSEDEFTAGIGIGKLIRRTMPLTRDDETDSWVGNLKTRLQQQARRQISGAAREISESLRDEMQEMLQELTESIARRQEGIRENAALPATAEGLKALEQLKSKLEHIRPEEHVGGSELAEPSSVSRVAFAGIGLAAIGLIMAALSRNAFIDIASVVIAGAGVILVGAGLLWRRADMLREFRRKLGASRVDFHGRVDAEFTQIFAGLFYEVREALGEVIFRLDLQTSHLAPVIEDTFRTGQNASEMLLLFQRTLAAQEEAQAQAQPAA